MGNIAEAKLSSLKNLLKELGRVAVAFSGGVDSSMLAVTANEVLSKNAVAVTIISPLLTQSERNDIDLIVKERGLRHVTIDFNELENSAFAANTPDRCYICKKARIELMAAWGKVQGFKWLLDGSNADDLNDYRPGMKALAEYDMVRSPLLEVGLTKNEIRMLSHDMGLFTWNKPAKACLASRLPYEDPITIEKLRLIESAESFLAQFLPPERQFRVRLHGELARIEMDDGLSFFTPEIAEEVHKAFTVKMGFKYVTLDLGGYRMGSLNNLI